MFPPAACQLGATRGRKVIFHPSLMVSRISSPGQRYSYLPVSRYSSRIIARLLIVVSTASVPRRSPYHSAMADSFSIDLLHLTGSIATADSTIVNIRAHSVLRAAPVMERLRLGDTDWSPIAAHDDSTVISTPSVKSGHSASMNVST